MNNRRGGGEESRAGARTRSEADGPLLRWLAPHYISRLNRGITLVVGRTFLLLWRIAPNAIMEPEAGNSAAGTPEGCRD